MESSFGRFYLVLQCFADGFNILSLCTNLFRKKIKTNNKRNSKQAKPTKQTRENSDKLFLTALSLFFIYVL